MISIAKADALISQNLKIFPVVNVSLKSAYGNVLREQLFADRDVPPYDRAMMDGIAIKFSSFKNGVRTFPVKGIQKAGSRQRLLKNPLTCIEVTTGAMIPKGCDCVIPYEDIELLNGVATIKPATHIHQGQFIHQKGQDAKKGTTLLKKGDRLLSPQIAAAASVGKTMVAASKAPLIAIVSTGDEIVDAARKNIRSYQIRASNAFAIESALQLNGFHTTRRFHVKDDQKKVQDLLKQLLKNFEIIIISGGVSKGKCDYILNALQALKTKIIFHTVNQKPGKPFLFGKNQAGKYIFGLPGNPVAVQVCMTRYILPNLINATGIKNPVKRQLATLTKPVRPDTSRALLQPVKIVNPNDNKLRVKPIPMNNSGDLICLLESDGFIELKAGTYHPKGTTAPFYSWGNNS
ncbi:MAG: molybdopterin molybdotransferase MoeA [Candidatus Omnitrophica bacterium]|nr:molybdopterin molybdotransferase MoeA [Candidatus Omnitrophota bacterium]